MKATKKTPKKQKLKALRTVTAPRNIKAIDGWGIDKGTVLHIVNDSAPVHPIHGYKLLVVRVDNGTGMLEFMPENVVRDTDLK